MKPVRIRGWVLSLGVLGGVLLAACGGDSTTFENDDDGTGGSGNSSGTGGSPSGGTSSKGGTGGSAGTPATGGAPTGGTGTGGSAGTGGVNGVCEDITPCGGDPEGAWNVTENCTEILIPIFEEPGCEDVLGAGEATLEGTFTFADGIMTQDTTISVALSVTIDDDCAQGLVGLPDITAADVCPLLNAQVAADPMAPGTCAVAPGGCRCDVVQAPMPNMTSQGYEIVGNQLVFANDGGALDFCQDGDELHVHGDGLDIMSSTASSLTLLLERVQ